MKATEILAKLLLKFIVLPKDPWYQMQYAYVPGPRCCVQRELLFTFLKMTNLGEGSGLGRFT